MSEPRRHWFWGRRFEDLEPELFWLALALFWLFGGLSLWRYSGSGSVWDLGLAVLLLAMGIRGLVALRRRRARREP